MNIYLLKTLIDDRETLLLSIANPEIDPNAKLSSKAIIGFVLNPDQPVSFENTRFNPAFIDHFHKTIVFFAQVNDGVIQMVEQQQNGFIYITDQRNKETEPTQENIIGSFEVQHGALVHGSYVPNAAYKLITAEGGFELQPELEALLYASIVG
jgi:hypothetical protein